MSKNRIRSLQWAAQSFGLALLTLGISGCPDVDMCAGVTCDDGLFCNGAETCNSETGMCEPGTAPCDPDTQECDEANNVCIDLCTTNVNCNDDNDCTDDTCGDDDRCVFTPDNTNTCDDGDVCTEMDTCAGGVCAGAAIAGCCTNDADCDAGQTCVDGDCVTTVEPVSLAAQIQPIFDVNCLMACHDPEGIGDAATGLRLTEGESFTLLVNQPSGLENCDETRVVPGNSGASLLFSKVSSDTPLCGDRMPLFGSPLTPDEIALIRDWIDQGAQNN